MKNQFFKIMSTALCGIVFSTSLLSAAQNNRCCDEKPNRDRCVCPEKSYAVEGIEKNLELLRGSVYNLTFTRSTETGDFLDVVCPPLRPLQSVSAIEPGIGFGFSTSSTIRTVDVTSQIASAIGGTATGVVRIFIVSVNVAFDCPFKKDPSVVASLENSPPTVLATPTAAVGSFGLIVNNVTRKGFTADLIFEVYGDSSDSVNDAAAFILTPGPEEGFPGPGGGIAFNFIATAPK